MLLSLNSAQCPAQEEKAAEQSQPYDLQPGEKILDAAQAQKYMLELINRDRASLHLRPVEFDELASKAAQAHVEEMAQHGYLSHWGLDGKKPDQRYTEGGGSNYVMENAHILNLGLNDDDKSPKVIPVAAEQKFTSRQMEEIESDFFNEKPPNDGHRKNIIDPDHTNVGIALCLASDADGYRVASTQEFTNIYGVIDDIPIHVKLGDTLKLKGKLNAGINIYAVDLGWEDYPKPMSIAQLAATYSYNSPDALVSFWPQGFKTPVPIMVDDQGFSLDLPLSRTYKPGIYYLTIWGKRPGDKEAIVVSDRVITVDK